MLQSEPVSSSTQDIDALTFAVWEQENYIIMQALAESFAEQVEQPQPPPPPSDDLLPPPPPDNLNSLRVS